MKARSSLFIILLCLVIIYGVAHVVANQKLNNWIEQNDNLKVTDAKLNILMGNLSASGVEFDDDRYTTKTCEVESIKLRGFSILAYLIKDEIDIDEISLHHANIFLTSPPKTDSAKQPKRKFCLSRLTLDSFDINYKTEKFSLKANQGVAQITDIKNVDKLQFEGISLIMSNIAYQPIKDVYNILANQIEVNSSESKLKVNNFLIQPQCSVEEWPSCNPTKKSRIIYKVGNITGRLDSTLFAKGIYLSELEIDDGLLEVLSYQEMENVKLPKKFFMEQFDALNIPINIPLIEVKSHTINALLKKESVDTISFDQVYATLNNVTNIPDRLKENNTVRARTISKFMDTKLSVDFEFKIKDTLNAYNFKLELDPMPFANLNKALTYNTPIAIERGKLQQLDCEVTGNNVSSLGQCALAYKDLYINIENKQNRTKKFLSKLLNFIVKDGPEKSDDLASKTYEASLDRDTNRDFFFQAYSIILQIIRQAMLPI